MAFEKRTNEDVIFFIHRLVYNEIIIYICRNIDRNMGNNKNDKASATISAFLDLGGMINKTMLSERYFRKSQAWFSQRLNGCVVSRKSRSFNENEYRILSDAFRDIAKKLQEHADRIDEAGHCYTEQKG